MARSLTPTLLPYPACIIFLLCTSLIHAKDIPVCPTCECTAIQPALNEAQNGDKIIIHAGTYREGNILVEKEIELTGEGIVILDGEKKHEIITVRANNVTIKNLHLQNSGSAFSRDIAAIKIERVKNCVVENCKVNGSQFGIYLSYAQQCSILNNTVEGVAVDELTAGDAIHLWNCRKINVLNNKVSKHRDGIYLELSDNCLIEKNCSEGNVRYGLHFMFSDNSIYRQNVFTKNQAGVAVMYSHHITMRENEFSGNWGPSSYGLMLKEIKDGEISGNTFRENTTAIFAEDTYRMSITGNVFNDNGWALKIADNCKENIFSGNNFLANTFEVGTNTRTNENRFEKNFWSNYSGHDMNRDGIGDIPHRPATFFTYLVEKQPATAILMKSPLINLLDLTEKASPQFSPVTLQDEQPLMQPPAHSPH